MRFFPPPWRRAAAQLAAGAALSAAAWHGSALAAEPAVLAAPAHNVVVVPDLATARQMALEHQPSVQAARASLAAAEARRDSLEHMRLAGLLARDLPVRKKQAELGVQSAQAALCQAEIDARYDVTYTWLAVLYAREQQEVADEARKRLTDLRKTVNELFTGSERRQLVKKEQVDAVDSLLKQLDARTEEAVQGEKRALAALREALGVGLDCVVVVPKRPLPDVRLKLNRDELVCAALSHRGEVTQAAVALEVTGLEIDAQRATFFPSSRTFALGSDIHAQVLPAPSRGFDYKPGAIGLEMPPTMTGHRSGRIDQATAYHDRAGALVEKTRNLITLETEDAYLHWQEKSIAAERLDEAEEKARAYLVGLQSTFGKALDKDWYPTVENLISAGSGYTHVRIDAREAHFHALVLLARLERVTGGALCVHFDAAPPPHKNKPNP
jgi:outer membrane protein TolC